MFSINSDKNQESYFFQSS